MCRQILDEWSPHLQGLQILYFTKSRKPSFLRVLRNKFYWKIFIFQQSCYLFKNAICCKIFSRQVFSLKKVFLALHWFHMSLLVPLKYKLVVDGLQACQIQKFFKEHNKHLFSCLKSLHLIRQIKFLSHQVFRLEVVEKQVLCCHDQSAVFNFYVASDFSRDMASTPQPIYCPRRLCHAGFLPIFCTHVCIQEKPHHQQMCPNSKVFSFLSSSLLEIGRKNERSKIIYFLL